MQLNTPPQNCKMDVHCHLFNKNVLTWRLLVDFAQSRKGTPFNLPTDGLDSLVGSFKKMKRAYNFLKVGLKPSSEEVYKILVGTEKNYAVAPLMFDLNYCMIGAHGEEDALLREEIEAEFNGLLSEDKEELSRMKMEVNSFAHADGEEECIDENEVDELLQTIDLLLCADSNALDYSDKEDPFVNQERQLVELKRRYPDKVFPFYAVDPRRTGNYSVEKGIYNLDPIVRRLAKNGGHFQGIKLYTPNGYSPADPMLMELYAYCEKHAIPITAHCSGSGFASFAKAVPIRGLIYRHNAVEEYNGILTFNHFQLTDGERVREKALLLNHPLLWERVLERYPMLKLNLAHFGVTEGSEEWSEHIVRLMDKYPNVYTDFSCVSDMAVLAKMHEKYYAKAKSSVKKRFLYGSDFYLNMLFADSMEHYLNHFLKVFTSSEMKAITEENPREFLSFQ